MGGAVLAWALPQLCTASVFPSSSAWSPTDSTQPQVALAFAALSRLWNEHSRQGRLRTRVSSGWVPGVTWSAASHGEGMGGVQGSGHGVLMWKQFIV